MIKNYLVLFLWLFFCLSTECDRLTADRYGQAEKLYKHGVLVSAFGQRARPPWGTPLGCAVARMCHFVDGSARKHAVQLYVSFSLSELFSVDGINQLHQMSRVFVLIFEKPRRFH